MTPDNWLKTLENVTSEELHAWHSAIDAELKRREAKAKLDAVRQIKDLAVAHGIDLTNISSVPVPGRRHDPKYRNPNDPFATWSGVGRKPKWVEDWLTAGNRLEELEIH